MKVKNQYLKILEYLHLSFNKWPSIQYKVWVSLVLWNHNNGEDCWLGNDPEDEHWHPPQRGKSQKVITERCGCSRSAVSKHIKCKVDWKEEFGWEKVHKQQGWPQAWEYSQTKLIQTLGRASQGVDWSWSHHAQTSSGKGLPSHFWTRDNVRSILPGLWRKKTQWSKVLFSDESKFCISFGNQGPRVWRKSGEAQNPCCLKSSVKFPQSVMIWAAMSSAGVGPPVCWSPQSTQPSTRKF